MKYLLACIALALPVAANAQQMTTGDLLGICTSPVRGDASACRLYILGVAEGLSLGGGLNRRSPSICIAEGVTSYAMTAAVLNKAKIDTRAFPDDLKRPAVSVAGAILLREFPCQPTK